MVDRAKPSARNEHERPPFAGGEIDRKQIVRKRHVEPTRRLDEDYFVTRGAFVHGADDGIHIDCAPFERSGEKR